MRRRRKRREEEKDEAAGRASPRRVPRRMIPCRGTTQSQGGWQAGNPWACTLCPPNMGYAPSRIWPFSIWCTLGVHTTQSWLLVGGYWLGRRVTWCHVRWAYSCWALKCYGLKPEASGAQGRARGARGGLHVRLRLQGEREGYSIDSSICHA